MNKQVEISLNILGFSDNQEVPKLKVIKEAYHGVAKEKHPDKHSGDTEESKKKYEEDFKELLAAYLILIFRFIYWHNSFTQRTLQDYMNKYEHYILVFFKYKSCFKLKILKMTAYNQKNHLQLS
ncbi:MAG: DnaJ domain-containing protein [Proteobacteria bacterium]|nr:DnaJ domain-containing protein [Pseudomonadota bacterium]